MIEEGAGILQGGTGFGAGIVMMMVLPSLFPLNQGGILRHRHNAEPVHVLEIQKAH